MKKRVLAVLLVGGLLFASCSAEEPVDLASYDYLSAWDEETGELDYFLDERIPVEIRDIVRANREDVFKEYDAEVEVTVRSYLTTGLDPVRDQEVAALVSAQEGERPAQLTVTQVETELAFLFDFLKYGYGGYAYYGGDAVFLPLKAQLQEQLAVSGEQIKIDHYEEILASALLEMIPDSHFMLGSMNFGKEISHRHFYLNEEQMFRKEGEAFLTTIDGTDYLLTAVEDEDPAQFVKPLLSKEGQLVWGLGVPKQTLGEYTLKLSLTGMPGELRELELPVYRAANMSVRENHTVYNLREQTGIKILENRSFSRESKELNRMVKDAKTLSDEPFLIIDLRHNGGGDTTWAFNWLYEYSGSYPALNLISARLTTKTVREVFRQNGVETDLTEDTDFDWDGPDPSYGSKLPNQNLVFVLTDQEVASSGEGFLRMLQQMENVIVVGTNTMGCSTVGNTLPIYLPESKLYLNCGAKLFLAPDLSPFEGTGYLPDLWCPPGEAVERVLAFIENLSYNE